ncbi:Right handed beta helix region [Sandaracinus amylolyticus]|nr:Right handed beta helix region [Sandaracinus amylolyticus]
MVARAVVLALLLLVPMRALARDVPVSDATSLRAALADARPGDVIVLADGTYDVDANLRCDADGSADAPIVVRAVTALGAHVRFDAVEGFVVRGAHWRFEDLEVEGVCADDSACEHAWHIVGDADRTVVRGNRAHGFNAHIKANGEGDPRVWPDDVLVEDNEFFNPRARMTSNPVTPIDVVGGRRWIVRGNYIHDHHKGMGDGVSYAAFLKGNSRDGIIERNLVVCEQLHTGGVRLGLSLGGGGTGPDSICEGGTCTPEHQGGILRNNVIVHCPADVGVYVNECADCLVAHNTLAGTTGIDVRFAASDVRVIGNLLSGRVRARDGATLASSGNREMVTEAEWSAWFVAPGEADFTLRDGAELVDRGAALAEVTDDFCGNDRDDGMPDLGAVEHDGDGPCDTTMPGGGGATPGVDAGIAGDAGSEEIDAGPRADAGMLAGEVSGGCGCRAGGRGPTRVAWLALLALVALSRRARSRSRRGAPDRMASRAPLGTTTGGSAPARRCGSPR